MQAYINLKGCSMALVTEGFEVSVTLADNGGNRSTLRYVCDPANVTDFATAQTARLSIVTALGNISESTIVGTALVETQYEDAIVYPPANVENENKASITYQILGKNKKGNLKIPAPEPAIFVGSSEASANQVNTQNALVTAYMGNFQAAGYFLVSDGEKVAANPAPNGVIVGKRISAKNNNG